VSTVNAATGDFLYQPAPDYFGPDAFTVRVTDGGGKSADGVVTIAVAAVNDAPQATAALDLATDEDAAVAGQLTVSDADNDTLTISTDVAPAHGTVRNITSAGGFVFEPNPDYFGTDSFRLRVADAAGASVSAAISVTVRRLVDYSGSTNAAEVSEVNASSSARSAWRALELVVQLSENALTAAQPGGAIDTSVNGDLAGVVRYSGTLAPNGTGTLTANYTAYRSSGAPQLTLSGRERIDILDPRTATTGRVRRSFKGLTLVSPKISATVGGQLLRVDSPGNGALAHHVTGELVLRETSGGAQHWFSNIDLTRTPTILVISDYFPDYNVPVNGWSGSLRAYDSRYGFLAFALEPSFGFVRVDRPAVAGGSDVSLAIGHGSLVIAGTGARRFWLTPLSPETFSLETNAGGGTPDRSLAFRWEDDFAASAGADTDREVTAVATMPVESNWATKGSPFQPEGRFSEDRQGRFLSHQWKVLSYPPGSTAQLVGANTPRPSFTADLSGWYLLGLTVSDGTHTSTDFVQVQSMEPGYSGTDGSPFGQRRIQGANPVYTAGQEIVLDARRSYNVYSHDVRAAFYGPYRWFVERQTHLGANTRVLTASPAAVVRFTPDQPGNYLARYVPDLALSPPWMYVQLNVMPTLRTTPVKANLGDISLDWDNDGDIDLLTHESDALTPSSYQLVRRKADGRFDAPQTLMRQRFDTSFTTHLFDDINGDGKLDVLRRGISSHPRTSDVSLQQADGSLGEVQMLGDGPEVCGPQLWDEHRYLGSVDIDRDGDLDIIRIVRCSSDPAFTTPYALVNRPNGDGTYADATPMPVPADIFSGIAADLDGDGDREIVGVPFFTSNPPDHLVVLSVNNSGGFDASNIPLSATYGASGTDVRAVDINGDGRLDLIAGIGTTFVLTQNADHTFTERARLSGAYHQLSRQPFPTADIDGDGRLDLFLGSSDLLPPPYTWYRQRTDGGFEAVSTLPAIPETLVDIDLDGHADLVTRGADASADILLLQVPQAQ
jgi:hypothetical protein